jgi:hypothetical protein
MSTHAILRRFIRESLREQGDVPGRWRANEVEPISAEDEMRIANRGWLSGDPDEELDEDEIEEVRQLIRLILQESPSGPGVAADPTDVKGFYPWDMERGTDIHSFWYRSPGRPMGADGDPGRPEDAMSYVGLTPPADNSVNAPGEEAVDEPAEGAPGDESSDTDELEPV